MVMGSDSLHRVGRVGRARHGAAQGAGGVLDMSKAAGPTVPVGPRHPRALRARNRRLDCRGAEEHKMYMWLFRQLKAGTGCSSVAAVSVGRFDKLEQLSSNWPDTNEVFVFGKTE